MKILGLVLFIVIVAIFVWIIVEAIDHSIPRE